MPADELPRPELDLLSAARDELLAAAEAGTDLEKRLADLHEKVHGNRLARASSRAGSAASARLPAGTSGRRINGGGRAGSRPTVGPDAGPSVGIAVLGGLLLVGVVVLLVLVSW